MATAQGAPGVDLARVKLDPPRRRFLALVEEERARFTPDEFARLHRATWLGIEPWWAALAEIAGMWRDLEQAALAAAEDSRALSVVGDDLRALAHASVVARALYPADETRPAEDEAYARVLLDRMADIATRKGHDYGGQEDSFRNLRRCRDIGIAPWRGVMVRLMDKWSRIENVVRQSGAAVADEKLDNDILDHANYALLGVVLVEEAIGQDHKEGG